MSTSGVFADLGQVDFTSGASAVTQSKFNSPRGLALDVSGRRLFVADYSNNRILVFDVATVTTGENAINVLGQTTFTASTAATAQNRLRNPAGLAYDASRGFLFTGDFSNHRVMVFDVNAITNGENAINILGQATFTTMASATTQAGMRNPAGTAIDESTGRLFVADSANHRVLMFDTMALTDGENAVNVLGQAIFTTMVAATTQAGMRSPNGVAIDPVAHRLFVADTTNHRVTVYDVTAVTDGENAVNVLGQVNFTSGSAATTQGRMSSPRGVLLPPADTLAATSITYDYDPLYRLTAADYLGGTYFHYTYDTVGNRLTEATQAGTSSYVYDNANRLTSVNSVTYAWDNRGNLLSDGVSTYTYDRANRLTAVSGLPSTYSFGYNGMGDRLRQTVNAVPTNYSLDLTDGLSQVLADGTNVYLYGPDLTTGQGYRIGEEQAGGWEYHLPDALQSSRQLANSSGTVALARSYQPFGTPLASNGNASSIFQFTGEARDGSGLTFLRARYLSTAVGRFTTMDAWSGDSNRPMSFNGWQYAFGNVVNLTDPSGHDPWWCDALDEPARTSCYVEYLLDSTSGSGSANPRPRPKCEAQFGIEGPGAKTAPSIPGFSSTEMGMFTISAYVHALESQFHGRAVEIPGMDGQTAREDFLFSRGGVVMQGSGIRLGGDFVHIRNQGDLYWVDARGRQVSAAQARWVGNPDEADFGSGSKVLLAHFSVAAPRRVPMGQLLYIPSLVPGLRRIGVRHNGVFRVDDRGGSISGARLDLFVGNGFGPSDRWFHEVPERSGAMVYALNSLSFPDPEFDGKR